MLIDSKGRLFGLVNIIDLSVIIVVLAMAFGFVWVRNTKGVLRQMVKATGPTEVTVVIRGARLQDRSLIKTGDKVFITIRNQPYAPVEVVKVSSDRRKMALMSPKGQVQTIDDPTDPLATDLLV